MAWTINHVEGALEQSLEAWGIEGATRRLVSQDVDTLVLTEPGGAYDTAALWAFDDTIILKQDATIWFVGRVGRARRVARPDGESREYEILGPWSWMDQLVYQQEWKTTNGLNATLVAMNKSRVIIGQDATGAKVATGAEMTAAINWAIAQGAPITLGVIDAGVTIPYQEVTDVTVAEVIRLCLRWTPDAVAWWDYTTAPNPTLNITRRADLTALDLALSPTEAKALDIVPRNDLVVPSVALHFEQSNSVDGVTYNATASDIKPIGKTGNEPRALVATIDLAGASATNERQTLKTEAINESNKAWWKKHVPAIKDFADAKLTITGATVFEYDGNGDPVASEMPRSLVEGTLSDWMGETSKPVVARAKITHASGTASDDFVAKEFTVDLIGTTADKPQYSRLVSAVAGETAPVGLAQALFDALSVLHWQGEYTKGETEVSGNAHPGKKLNLTGGLAAWTAMGAMIQTVEEDILTGDTRISFGPPEHLSPQDLVERLRANRGAAQSWRLEERTTAIKAANGGQHEGPKYTPKHNATAAPGGGGGTSGTPEAFTVIENGLPITVTFLTQS